MPVALVQTLTWEGVAAVAGVAVLVDPGQLCDQVVEAVAPLHSSLVLGTRRVAPPQEPSASSKGPAECFGEAVEVVAPVGPFSLRSSAHPGDLGHDRRVGVG